MPKLAAETWIWLILVGFTLLMFAAGREHLDSLGFSLTVLGVAVCKGFLVGDWFMGLRRLSGIWRWVVAIWLLIPAALITIAFALTQQ